MDFKCTYFIFCYCVSRYSFAGKNNYRYLHLYLVIIHRRSDFRFPESFCFLVFLSRWYLSQSLWTNFLRISWNPLSLKSSSCMFSWLSRNFHWFMWVSQFNRSLQAQGKGTSRPLVAGDAKSLLCSALPSLQGLSFCIGPVWSHDTTAADESSFESAILVPLVNGSGAQFSLMLNSILWDEWFFYHSLALSSTLSCIFSNFPFR